MTERGYREIEWTSNILYGFHWNETIYGDKVTLTDNPLNYVVKVSAFGARGCKRMIYSKKRRK